MATSPYGGFVDLNPYRGGLGGEAVNPLESLIQGFTQGQAIRNLPQAMEQQRQAQLQDELSRRLNIAMQQQKLEGFPLEQERQNLLLQQLRAQLDPNYEAKQNAAKIQFATDQARALGQVQKELATSVSTPLKFTETDTEIIAQNPFTADIVSKTPKQKGVVYQKTDNGIFAITDPSKPTEGTIIPGTGPITSGGGAQPVFNPQNPSQIIGYQVPSNFKSISDLKIEPVQSLGEEFTQERAQRNLSSVADLRAAVSPLTVGLGSLISYIPGTGAADFKSNVDTLKANIAFSELQAMRNASKTGGALGQVAVRELELLQSALGALDTRQSKDSFIKNLDKIEASITKFKNASDKKTQPPPATSTGPKIIKITPRAK